MSAWQYCHECGHGMNEPTPHDVVDGEQCCNSCGHCQLPLKSLGELVLELLERIKQLEEKV